MTRGYIAQNESLRQLRASEVIRQAVAEIFLKGKFLDPKLFDASITVTQVKVSVDLKHAHIYVLPFSKLTYEDLLSGLNQILPSIRRSITSKIGFKFSPEIVFFIDDTLDHASRINNLIDSAKKT